MQTNYAGLQQRTNVYAAAEMLAHAQPQAVLTRMGLTKPMPKNKSEQMVFRRAVPFPKLTTPLAEGVTPNSRTMQYEDVPVTMQQWGDVVECTDRVRDLSEDPAIKDAAMLLGEQAVETQEFVAWGVLRAGSQVVYNNGTQRTDVNTAISLNKIHSAIRTLRNNRAKFITSILDGSVNYNTTPIEGGFVAVCHTDLEHDIRLLAGFTPVAEYGKRSVISEYELGSVETLRFVLSPTLEPFLGAGSGTLNGMRSVGGTAVDVYPVVILARDCFAHIPLKGSKSVETYVLTGADKSDPLNQRDVVGAKYWYTAIRLNEGWMIRIECGVTAL